MGIFAAITFSLAALFSLLAMRSGMRDKRTAAGVLKFSASFFGGFVALAAFALMWQSCIDKSVHAATEELCRSEELTRLEGKQRADVVPLVSAKAKAKVLDVFVSEGMVVFGSGAGSNLRSRCKIAFDDDDVASAPLFSSSWR